MTGSGKTGLGVVLIEEVLRAGVPVIAIDPKGDLTNLRLMFPNLAPADFRPWIDEVAGQERRPVPRRVRRRAGDAVDATGLGRVGLRRPGHRRVARRHRRHDLHAGLHLRRAGEPGRLAAGAGRHGRHRDVADEIGGYVSGLLGLVGIEADPLSSREHILLSNLIHHSWQQGAVARSADARRTGRDAADPQARRVRTRPVLPRQGPHGAGDEAQRSARVAVVRRVGRR